MQGNDLTISPSKIEFLEIEDLKRFQDFEVGGGFLRFE